MVLGRGDYANMDSHGQVNSPYTSRVSFDPWVIVIYLPQMKDSTEGTLLAPGRSFVYWELKSKETTDVFILFKLTFIFHQISIFFP